MHQSPGISVELTLNFCLNREAPERERENSFDIMTQNNGSNYRVYVSLTLTIPLQPGALEDIFMEIAHE